MAKPPKKNFSGKSQKSRPFQKDKGGRPTTGRDRPERGDRPARKAGGTERGKFREDRPAPSHRPPAREPKEPKAPRIKADLFGFHAVREAWHNEKRYVHALYLTEAAHKEFAKDLETAAKRPAPVIVAKEELDRAFPPGTVHQGIALSCQPLAEQSVMDLVIRAQNNAAAKSVIVILDQVTDPHNVGAILRSACAFGADGVVMQSRHAPELNNGILAKTACGAVDHLPVAYETNLSRAIETLKEHHYTVIGMDEHAPQSFGDLPSYDRAVIVLGAEGPGMRRLIKDHCDVLVTLPTQKPINSLNVSNAAAVALYALTA